MATEFDHMTIQSLTNYSCLLFCLQHSFIYGTNFTRKVYNETVEKLGFQHFCDCRAQDSFPVFDTLKRNGFIIKIDEIHSHVFKDISQGYCGYYGGDIIDMTDEEYQNLPKYFKDMVEVEDRVTYIYKFNCKKINKLIEFANYILKFSE